MGKQMTFFELKVFNTDLLQQPPHVAQSDIDIHTIKEFGKTAGTHGILLTFFFEHENNLAFKG